VHAVFDRSARKRGNGKKCNDSVWVPLRATNVDRPQFSKSFEEKEKESHGMSNRKCKHLEQKNTKPILSSAGRFCDERSVIISIIE
jgi:hypothetical protein